MRKMRVAAVVLVAVTASMAAVISYLNSAVGVSRHLTGLPIPLTSRVEEFKSEGSFFKGGILFVRLKLSPGAFERVVQHAKAEGYLPLPVTEGRENATLWPYMSANASGWYMIKRPWERSTTFTAVVLDDHTRILTLGYVLD